MGVQGMQNGTGFNPEMMNQLYQQQTQQQFPTQQQLTQMPPFIGAEGSPDTSQFPTFNMSQANLTGPTTDMFSTSSANNNFGAPATYAYQPEPQLQTGPNLAATLTGHEAPDYTAMLQGKQPFTTTAATDTSEVTSAPQNEAMSFNPAAYANYSVPGQRLNIAA